ALIAGRKAVEHNDVAFLAYVSLSIWSFTEYHYSQKKYWIYLIGLFSGMAILCKWLVGLLVYFGWFVLKIMQRKFRPSENVDLLISLIVTLVVALPWQILIFSWYPVEAAGEYTYNALHFTVALEGHGGDCWYHLNKFNLIYGAAAPFLVVPAFFVLHRKMNDRDLFFSLLSMVGIVYLFFSLAATKMSSFTLVASMIVFISFGALFNHITDYVDRSIKKKWTTRAITGLFILLLVAFRFDIEYLQEKHTKWRKDNKYSRMLAHNKEIFESLQLPPHTVLFNVKGRHYVEAMFYTGLTAYHFIPTLEQYENLKEKDRGIAIFDPGKSKMPAYLKNDTTVIVIKERLRGYK
ncbi:MAG: hypothetical protein AAGI38_22970, partial [Bacteroidota bacterium]